MNIRPVSIMQAWRYIVYVLRHDCKNFLLAVCIMLALLWAGRAVNNYYLKPPVSVVVDAINLSMVSSKNIGLRPSFSSRMYTVSVSRIVDAYNNCIGIIHFQNKFLYPDSQQECILFTVGSCLKNRFLTMLTNKIQCIIWPLKTIIHISETWQGQKIILMIVLYYLIAQLLNALILVFCVTSILSFYRSGTIQIANALRLSLKLAPIGFCTLMLYQFLIGFTTLICAVISIFVSVRYAYAIPLLVEKHVGTIAQALSASSLYTDNAKIQLALVSIINGVISFIALYDHTGLVSALHTVLHLLTYLHIYSQSRNNYELLSKKH